jgi:HEAT repeat protein
MLRIFLALALLTPACASRAKRSVSLYESGDYAGSVRAADEGLAGHPDDDDLWAMKVRASLALGDADAVAKAYAGYMAARGEDDKDLLRDLSTATIAQALASPSVRLKIDAINAIAELEIHSLADQVAESMGDDDDRVAATASIAVLKGFPQAPAVADDLTRSENGEARRIAIDGIGKKVGKLALADLEKAASDRDARVRRVAVRWLGQLKDKDAVEILAKRMRDPDEGVRAAAATALARIGVGNLAAFGTQALADHTLSVRLAGVDLLVAAHRDDPLVALAAGDKDAMVALAAAIAVKSSHPELTAKAVDRAASDEEWTTRAGAANYLVTALGKANALAVARRMTTDTAIGVRLAAARVLLHAGDKAAATPIFTAALTDANQGVHAAADLASIGDPAGINALSTFVRDKTTSADQRVAAVLAHRSAHRVTPGLVAALADSSGIVRVAAAAVLGALARDKS